jgi:uroporphyrinogen-III synthase
VAKPNEAVLREATSRCLAAPCDEVVVSSGFGLRAWVSAAGRWQAAEPLAARFAGARLLARDAAAADELRRLGLTTIFSAERETTEDLLRYLLAQPLGGRRVVVQTDRLSLTEPCQALREAGAEVIEIPTYTAMPPPESFSLRRLADLVIRRQVDALAVVGGEVTAYLCDQAGREGLLTELRAALEQDVLCVALGPGTAQPLGDRAVPAGQPFVEHVAEAVLAALPRRGLQVAVGDHRLEVRGRAVVLDGRLVAIPGGPLAVLRALARDPGRVLTAAEIRRHEPSWAGVDDHAVEMAVSRLRRALDGAELVQTIVNRGYRLAD